jgi:hypothetical protein
MSEDSITGAVDNGRRGTAIFRFYEGPVGIRERDGAIELAFFSPPLRYRLPEEGLVDGQAVRVSGVRAREIDPDMPASTRSTAPRAIVMTVVPIEPKG